MICNPDGQVMLNPFETSILLDEEIETSFDDSKEVTDYLC